MARLIRMPRTIRARLTWILAIPVTLLLGVTGVEVAARFDARADAHTAARQVELVLAAQDLVHELQRERGLTAGLLGGDVRFRGELDQQRRRVDEAQARLRPLLADPERRGVPRLRAALDRLSGLGGLRASADTGQTSRQDGFAFYTAAIGAINDALFDADAGRGDPALRRELEALWTLGRAQEAAAQERDTLTGALAARGFAPDEYVRFIESRAAKADALARFTRIATPAQAGAIGTAQQSRAAAAMGAVELRAAASPRGRNLTVAPREWWGAASAFLNDLREVRRSVGEEASTRARQAEAHQARWLVVLAVLGGVLLLGVLVLGLVTSRSILRPLRRLTREANDVAERRLPEAVARIQATGEAADSAAEDEPGAGERQDEFAEAARALRNVHRTALRLAAEQAVLRRNTAESLANLGRRNQTLVRRQLKFISALERDESDPAALANLFELDHLATRMRRNAESLLILVGERIPRPAAEPVAMGDVLRSALAEVEDYRRVVLRRVDHDVMRGAVVAEVAHLLAELIENALVFSPPDQDVEIQARCDATEYHIAIVDQGVGMSPEELVNANARLRGEQSFLGTPTRQLGLYVVGRLAERLGIKVWLHDSPLAGITARVVLPGDLLVRDGTAAGAHAPAEGASAAARASDGAAADAEPSPVPARGVVPGVPPAGTPAGTPAGAGAGTAAEASAWPAVPADEAPVPPGAAGSPAAAAAPGAAKAATAEFVAVVPVPEPAEPPAPGTPPAAFPPFVAPASTGSAPAVRPAAPAGDPAVDAASGPAADSPDASPAPARPPAPPTPPAPPAAPQQPAPAASAGASAPRPSAAKPAALPFRPPIPLQAKPPYRLSVRRPVAAGPAAAAGRVTGDGETAPNGMARRTPPERPRGEDPAYGGHDEPGQEDPVDRVRSMINEFRAGARSGEQVGAHRDDQ